MGADAVLLIVRILGAAQLYHLLRATEALGLTALVEVYTAVEAQAAADAGAQLVGINNRDLASFDTDLSHTLEILPALAPGQTAVAASGIRSRADILRYAGTPVFNFLVGESLVRATDPARAVRELRGAA
jgi:indole-3-glycerol phosphate synthase